METTAILTSVQDPKWRWVYPVTRTTRDFFTSQLPVLVISYAVAVALIYVAARIEGNVETRLVLWWLAESIANITIRSWLVDRVARASPVAVASRPALRLLPLIAIGLAAAHWSWTATIFIGSTLDLTTLVLLLVFVMLSVATVGLAPASPLICIVYLTPMWLVTSYKLLHANWVSTGTLVVLLAAVAAVLWPAFYVAVSGVRRNLVRSDELDLLVEQLRERNEEVEGLRSAAATDLSTRSSFFASASHDFRQRVHAMKLLTRAGLDAGARGDGARASLSRLALVLEDLESYMTDVLGFVRLETMAQQSHRAKVSLQRIFQQIELQFEDVAASKRVELRVRSTPLVLETDSAMLLRILENLVSNAIKFTRGNVVLAARRCKGGVCIEVRDQGPGISEASLDHVFDAFYQGERSSHDAREGVGLGLAIVRRLVQALDYRIEVQTVIGRGTMMRVLVPRRDVVERQGEAHGHLVGATA